MWRRADKQADDESVQRRDNVHLKTTNDKNLRHIRICSDFNTVQVCRYVVLVRHTTFGLAKTESAVAPSALLCSWLRGGVVYTIVRSVAFHSPEPCCTPG